MHWLGLFISIGVLLLVARRSLPLAFLFSALLLGAFTLSPMEIWMTIRNTVTDSAILLLALAMGVIPVIGEVMERSGQISRLVNNLRVGRRMSLVLSPALVGMLPVPGGALLSSPLVEEVGKGILGTTKAAVNVWYRHVLFMVYPLDPTLILSARIAGLGVYTVIPYLFPGFIAMTFIGWTFFLRDVEGEIGYRGPFSARHLVLSLSIILLAPLLDYLLPRVFFFRVPEWTTLIAVLCSLGLALFLGRRSLRELGRTVKRAAPWHFSLMIMGMFLFFSIFQASGMAENMASLAFSEPLLCLVSFLLGVFTGRVYLPTSVVIPTYMSMAGSSPLPPAIFALLFFSALLGYLVSPAHPCVFASLEYFGADMGDYLRTMALPVLLALAPALLLALVLSLRWPM
jgi:integral membrane protein (TIGR00529 family)